MVLKLYYNSLSPPARAVHLTEKALGIETEKINVTLPEIDVKDFDKINPQHTIPTFIDEDGTVLWESHAIMSYLVGKYGKNDSLYPKDLLKRALVDQRMFFETEYFFCMIRRILMPLFLGKKTKVSDVCAGLVEKAYERAEKFLKGNDWMAGDSLTIADLSLVSSITTLNLLVPIDSKYVNLLKWIKRMEGLPYYHVNQEGLVGLVEFLKKIIK